MASVTMIVEHIEADCAANMKHKTELAIEGTE